MKEVARSELPGRLAVNFIFLNRPIRSRQDLALYQR